MGGNWDGAIGLLQHHCMHLTSKFRTTVSLERDLQKSEGSSVLALLGPKKKNIFVNQIPKFGFLVRSAIVA